MITEEIKQNTRQQTTGTHRIHVFEQYFIVHRAQAELHFAVLLGVMLVVKWERTGVRGCVFVFFCILPESSGTIQPLYML